MTESEQVAMTLEAQFDKAAFLKSVEGVVNDWLNNVETSANGSIWVDRVDRTGELDLVSGAVRIPVRVHVTSEADVIAHPNGEPRGPSTAVVDTEILLASGTIDGAQVRLPASAVSVDAHFPAQTATLPVQTASIASLLFIPPGRLSFTADRAVLHLGSDPDPERRIPDAYDWCVSLPAVLVASELEARARDNGFAADTTYREEGGRPYFDFNQETRLDLPAPLTNLPAHVTGSVTLSIQSSGDACQLVATIAGSARPLDENWVGSVASGLVALTDGHVAFTMSVPAAEFQSPRLFALKGKVEHLSSDASHILIAGSAHSPDTAPSPDPVFRSTAWSGLIWFGKESAMHMGHPQTAISTASLTLEGPGHLVEAVEPDDGNVFFNSVPSPTVTIDGPNLHLSITAEEIERRTQALGSVSYRLLVHSTRGRRLIDFGVPPQPVRDSNGGITNAEVIGVPDLELVEPTIESPISDPPDHLFPVSNEPSPWLLLGAHGPTITLRPQLPSGSRLHRRQPRP